MMCANKIQILDLDPAERIVFATWSVSKRQGFLSVFQHFIVASWISLLATITLGSLVCLTSCSLLLLLLLVVLASLSHPILWALPPAITGLHEQRQSCLDAAHRATPMPEGYYSCLMYVPSWPASRHRKHICFMQRLTKRICASHHLRLFHSDWKKWISHLFLEAAIGRIWFMLMAESSSYSTVISLIIDEAITYWACQGIRVLSLEHTDSSTAQHGSAHHLCIARLQTRLFAQRGDLVAEYLSGCSDGSSAIFSMTAMKNPPVSPWWGKILMHRSRGIRADSSSGNMLMEKLFALLACTMAEWSEGLQADLAREGSHLVASSSDKEGRIEVCLRRIMIAMAGLIGHHNNVWPYSL